MIWNRKYITVALIAAAIIIAAIGIGFFVRTAGSKDKDANFEIYLVKETGSDAAQKTTLDKLLMEDAPLITYKDIVAYNWYNHSLKVKNNRKINSSLLKRSFVVVADRKRIYKGTFWSAIYSMWPPGVPVYLDGIYGHDVSNLYLNIGRFTINEKIPDDVLKTISDKRIYRSLKRLGILFEPASPKHVRLPDSITVYNNGIQKNIDVADDRDMYFEIIGLIDNRFGSKLSTVQLPMPADYESAIKKNDVAVEFLYKDMMGANSILETDTKQYSYSRLLMPLTGDWSDMLFMGDNNSYYAGPFGPLEKVGDLSLSDIPDTSMQTTELPNKNPDNNTPVSESDIKKTNYVTAVTTKCIAKSGPGDGYADAAEVPAGRLVRVTGMYLGSDAWMRATFVQGIEEKPDNTELWINNKNIVINAFEPVTFNNCRVDSAIEFTYVITSEKGEHWLVELKQTPEEKSPVVAEARGGDLIRILRNSGGDPVKIIRDNIEWSLVQKISDGNMVDTSDAGWIKTTNYTAYKTGMKTNQGFLLNGIKILDAPDDNAGILYKIAGLAQIFIVESKGEWRNINGGFNTFNAWVKTKDIKYCLAGEDPYKLANPEIDKKKFVQKIKEEIKNWKNIKLCAQDIKREITLTDGQKTALSDKLTSINNMEFFDGGYSPLREAVYPFYTLKLLDGSGSESSAVGNYAFTVVGNDKLLVEIPVDRLEDYYGISKNRVPIRFLTVNKEFVNYIMTLIPPPENNNKNDWNYLLNAKRVIVGETEGNYSQQVYKCVRAIRAAAGSEIEKADVLENAEEISNFKFLFGDGDIVNVLITDKYILYNGRYYTEKIDPNNITASLFAGYF